MASPASLPRALLVYVIVIPLALFLGYLLTTPMDFQTAMVVGLVFFVLVSPILIQSHQSVMLFAWNAHIVLAFLPGALPFWAVMAPVSLGFTMVNQILNRHSRIINVPSVSWSLVLMALVVMLTAKLRGGIGLSALGGSGAGGKGYVLLLCSIGGYWAISANVIPVERAVRAVRLFFLSGLTAVVSNLLLLGGPAFYFLFAFFPTGAAAMQLSSLMSESGMNRIGGLEAASSSVAYYLMARHGIRGLLTMRSAWATGLFVLAIVLLPLGGFRSIVAGVGITFILQFLAEGLHRTKYLAAMVGIVLLGGVVLIPLAPMLPLSAQRTISFLPLDLDPGAKMDAKASSEWRFEMWRYMLPDLPNYLWLGKGLSVNLSDVFLAEEARKRGLARDFEAYILAGNYHNGPLSLYVAFGSPGVLAFVFFLVAATRVVYRNWRHGREELKTINTFLFAYFVGQIPFFVLVFGAIDTHFFTFSGPIALSVALNGGMCGPQREREAE